MTAPVRVLITEDIVASETEVKVANNYPESLWYPLM